MPTKLSKYQQSIFDITGENFGTLDNLIEVCKDNQLALSDYLRPNTSLEINNTDLGEKDIKQELIDLKQTLNNNYQPLILFTVDSTLITSDNNIITADKR